LSQRQNRFVIQYSAELIHFRVGALLINQLNDAGHNSDSCLLLEQV
jgi:hypothetical protein